MELKLTVIHIWKEVNKLFWRNNFIAMHKDNLCVSKSMYFQINFYQKIILDSIGS